VALGDLSTKGTWEARGLVRESKRNLFSEKQGRSLVGTTGNNIVGAKTIQNRQGRAVGGGRSKLNYQYLENGYNTKHARERSSGLGGLNIRLWKKKRMVLIRGERHCVQVAQGVRAREDGRNSRLVGDIRLRAKIDHDLMRASKG